MSMILQQLRQAAPVVAVVVLGVLMLWGFAGGLLAACSTALIAHRAGGPVADWLSMARMGLGARDSCWRPASGLLPPNPIGWILLGILVLGSTPSASTPSWMTGDHRDPAFRLGSGGFGSDWPMLLVLHRDRPGRFPDWVTCCWAASAAGVCGPRRRRAAGRSAGSRIRGRRRNMDETSSLQRASGTLSALSRAWKIAGFMTIIAVLASRLPPAVVDRRWTATER